MSELFHNRVAIISGALGDIGRAIAHMYADAGASVALGDILPPEAAEPMIAALAEKGVGAHYQQCDVGDDAAVDAWYDAVEASLGLPAFIVPNAATVTRGTVLGMSPDAWRRELRVNLDGAYLMARAGAQRLVDAGKPGRIVFVGSWAAERAHPQIPAYSVSKAGLRMLMECLAIELGEHDICVNEVAPGYVDAGLSGKIFDEQPGLREKAQAKVPLRRLILPAEVAVQVRHLCHPENRHMTGSVITMDGGLSRKSPATS